LFFSSNKSDLSLQPKSNNLPFKSGDYCLISHFEHLSCIYISQAENNKANDFHTQDNFNFLTKVAAGKSMPIKVLISFLYYICYVLLVQKCCLSPMFFLPIYYIIAIYKKSPKS